MGIMFLRKAEFYFADIKGNQEVPLKESFKSTDVKDDECFNFFFDYSISLGISNTITINFYNLDDSFISLFHGNNTVRLIDIRVGYGKDPVFQLFKGQILKAYPYRNETDMVYHVFAVDLLSTNALQLFKNVYKTGISSKTIMKDALVHFAPHFSIANSDLLTKVYDNPISFVGNSLKQVADEIARDNGLMYAFHNSSVVFLKKLNNNTTQKYGDAISTISSDNILVGDVRQEAMSQLYLPIDYITKTDQSQNYPLISLTTLLYPFKIGQIVRIKQEIKNLNDYNYMIISMRYEGEFRGNNFFTHLFLAPDQFG